MNTESLRDYCLSLPFSAESIKWTNTLVFTIEAKMFCVCSLDAPFSFSVKVPDEIFDEIVLQHAFRPAPYLARAKWVQIIFPESLNRLRIEFLVHQSYQLVKTSLSKKLKTQLGIYT